jgi:hypothetical protein
MLDLDNQIARLEMRAEQMAIHLQDLRRNSPDAARPLRTLAILQELAELKSEANDAKHCLKWERLPSRETLTFFRRAA